MNNYACINNSSDNLAQNCAKQIGLGFGGAAFSSYSAHHASTVQQQQDAVSTLRDFNNNDIFTWLELARSARHIEPIPEQQPGERHLSPPQVLALSTLKNCPNDRLLGWLELSRAQCHTPSSHASQRSLESISGSGTVLPSLRAQPKQHTAKVTSGMSGAAPGPSQLITNPGGPLFATDNFPQHNSNRPSNSARSNKAENHYWCTVCEELKSYKDSGNWKKHEKEHETVFICGLNDAAEGSKAGQPHASKSFTCKRRDIMVNHLNKSHGITEALQGRDLANQWRHTVKKQAWSCGFCISLFLSFQDRLKHVDIVHFRRHQSIHEWDLNKVILGLLQQPKMENAWKTRMASLPPWVHPENISWDKATAKDLRATLEIGPSDDRHATTLADAAYFASKSKEGSRGQSGTNVANRHSDATAQASFLSSPSHYPGTSALTSDSELYHRPSPAITDSAAHLISNDPSFFEAPTDAFALGNTVEPSVSSMDGDGRVNHNVLPFNPSQIWNSAIESGTFFNGYDLPEIYSGRGTDWSAPNWYNH